jgi:hypothetical protein
VAVYGHAALDDVTVRGTLPTGDRVVSSNGVGVAGTAEITGGQLEDNQGSAIFVDTGATVTVTGTTITGGTRSPGSLCAAAIDVFGTATVRDVHVKDQAFAAFRVGAGATLTADEVTVDDVHWATGCYAPDGADLSLAGALFADGDGAHVTLSGSTLSNLDFAGIVASNLAEVDVTGTTIAQVRGTEGSENYRWRGTDGDWVNLPAIGAVMATGATVSLTDVDISEPLRLGVEVSQGDSKTDAHVELTRVTITDVTSSPDAGPGEALHCEGSGAVTWHGGTVERVEGTGVAIQGGCDLVADGLSVLDATPTVDGLSGNGLVVADASAALSGLVVRGAALKGVVACSGCSADDPAKTSITLEIGRIEDVGAPSIG